ncbi:alpha-L-rhamnosidase-related protein [Paenibacillus xylanivorans]|uniref:alpha-L-rhamnosidase-related protein n=1 Tax=Paenibacillus xylanivorans TaxID=1705561 RepID=UPI0038B32A64
MRYLSHNATRLAHLIRMNQGRLTTGFLGTPYLCEALSVNRHKELACLKAEQHARKKRV